MVIDCITIFPEMFAPMKQSIMGRAQAKGLLEFNTVYLRDFAINDYGQVDDVPYGGEPGMVLRPEPLAAAIRSTGVKQDGGKVIYLTADGVPFTHKIAEELSHESHLVLVCGHYKGIDDRIRQTEVDMEISIGDFVRTACDAPDRRGREAYRRGAGEPRERRHRLVRPGRTGMAGLHPPGGIRGKKGARSAPFGPSQEHFGVAEAGILEKNARKTPRHP